MYIYINTYNIYIYIPTYIHTYICVCIYICKYWLGIVCLFTIYKRCVFAIHTHMRHMRVIIYAYSYTDAHIYNTYIIHIYIDWSIDKYLTDNLNDLGFQGMFPRPYIFQRIHISVSSIMTFWDCQNTIVLHDSHVGDILNSLLVVISE